MADTPTLFCPHHPEVPMQREPGFYSINCLTPTPNGAVFHAEIGTPLRVFFCPICGRVELFTANKDPDWLAALTANTQ